MKTKILKEDPIIGRKYHVSWAKSMSMVWTLISFDKSKDSCVLKTKYGKIVTCKIHQLRNINRHSTNLDTPNP